MEINLGRKNVYIEKGENVTLKEVTDDMILRDKNYSTRKNLLRIAI